MADTNIKFLKENNLYEAHKQFMRMAEGYGYAAPIEEAGPDDDESQPNADSNEGMDADGAAPMGGADPSSAGDPNAMGGGAPMGGADPSQGGGMDSSADGDPNAMGGGAPMGGADPSQGGMDSSMDANAPMGDDVAGGMGDLGEPQDDEQVIDVDDIVKAQEKANNKVNSVGRDLGTVDRRIEKLLGALETMQGVIDKNNAEIADLKREFEKRNPTQTERLNLRSLDSYPFNVKPADYWRQKSMDSNYDAYADNDEPTTQEYTITNSDVDDINSDIDKTFSIPDDDMQDINKIFNLR